MKKVAAPLLALALTAACAAKPPRATATATATATAGRRAPAGKATVAEARAWIARTERKLMNRWIGAERAAWVKATYITFDTTKLAAQAYERVMAFTSKASAEATRFDGLDLPPDVRRKMHLLKVSLSLPAPRDAAQRKELAGIATRLDAIYGKGKYCSPRLARKWEKKDDGKGDGCLNLGELKQVIAKSRKYDELLEAWKGWRTISLPMRPMFKRYVELGNAGARSLGFKNLGDLWKSRYDMTPAAFEKEVDRLWGQVKPLYDQLHCYARARLQRRYGKARVPDGKPIPAHLFGNMWSQDWASIGDILLPGKGAALNLERGLKRKKVDARGMVRYAEGFFVSLGLPPLPKSFWERSMFTKPRDREVVCHASAWDIDWVEDLRIKMCIRINDEDFSVVHHELGHNYYQRAYNQQAPLFRDSANDGFHEGLGDTIALSVTPGYLKKLGLIRKVPKDDIATLLQRALDKVAFLPFGILIDKWRWDVFAGKITPADYNASWWRLRQKYQGIAPPVARSEKDFDPGAKYHIPANVPYTRYFLADILQFQFHRALCRIAGHEGPLHTCSIYGSKAAGARLDAMMKLGISRPWPEALKALSGETRLDASAILAYFQPLYDWLKKQNAGRACGW